MESSLVTPWSSSAAVAQLNFEDTGMRQSGIGSCSVQASTLYYHCSQSTASAAPMTSALAALC